MTPFGKILRKIRIDRNELLYDMAQKLKVSSAFLSAVENGKKNIPADLLEKVISIYTSDGKEEQELRDAADISAKEISFSLEAIPVENRDLALAFARRFSEMDTTQIDTLRSIFKSKKE